MIPRPPATSARPTAVYDTECFPNYWLLKVRPVGGASYSFSLRAGQALTADDCRRVRLIFDSYRVVSFNGNHYDVPMITAAITGYSCEQLKALNDRIIPPQIKGQPRVRGPMPWQLGLPEWAPADHIDVMEVAPGAGSQKMYAGRIHHKTMRDLPYDPFRVLTESEIEEVDEYCENDLDVLQALFDALAPQVHMREALGKRYGLDLRSKSDAQVAEAVLKKRCEQALGRTIYKPRDIEWNLKFRYTPPDYLAFATPQLQHVLELARASVFGIRPPASMRGDSDEKGKCIVMPEQLEGLEVTIGETTYKLGVGGLHSQEKRLALVSDETHVILMPDVAAYYPSLMLVAGAWPPALGPAFLSEFASIKAERIECKALAKKLKKLGFEGTVEYVNAATGDGGGKIMINGTFGKTGSPFSILFAPQMLIQTTLTGQLSILMLIEWLTHYAIPVVSANTDGLVIYCPRNKVYIAQHLIAEWEKRTGLEMETDEYVAIYARDVNNYFAIKSADDVKRKGEYAKAGLIEKKNPDVEICADAASDYLAKGIPVEDTIRACRDIRKFVTIQKVDGGGVKMWGDGPRKNARVRDMLPTLADGGWVKEGRRWRRGEVLTDSTSAYCACFAPQRPEPLGKVVRWYYGTRAPGPILYASNGNTVGMSYGAQPCMTLPDAFPDDVDYDWYIAKSCKMLVDVGK